MTTILFSISATFLLAYFSSKFILFVISPTLLSVSALILESLFSISDSFSLNLCYCFLIKSLVLSTSLSSKVYAIAGGTVGLVTLTAMISIPGAQI
jgi:uncharacterized sodium:solute symporter family permease YidK